MDILIFCNGLHTRTYLNAKIGKEDNNSFTVIYNNSNSADFNKSEYSYKTI